MNRLLLACLVMVAGFLIGLAIPRPVQVSYVTREVGIPYPVEIVVEKPVYTEVVKELEKIVPQYVDGWDSLDEFAAFLASDNTDKIRYADSPALNADTGLCFLYASALRYAAEREVGKYVSWQAFSPSDWKQITGETIDRWHAVVSIYNTQDGYLYFFEPQTDQQIPFKLKTILKKD